VVPDTDTVFTIEYIPVLTFPQTLEPTGGVTPVKVYVLDIAETTDDSFNRVVNGDSENGKAIGDIN